MKRNTLRYETHYVTILGGLALLTLIIDVLSNTRYHRSNIELDLIVNYT